MERLFTQSGTIKRQVYVNNKSSYSNIGTINCNLQSMDNEMSKINEIQIGRGFMLFCKTTDDIQETDIITINTQDYIINGITDYEMGGISYKKAMATKDVKI